MKSRVDEGCGMPVPVMDEIVLAVLKDVAASQAEIIALLEAINSKLEDGVSVVVGNNELRKLTID